jgi:hypothetical protein
MHRRGSLGSHIHVPGFSHRSARESQGNNLTEEAGDYLRMFLRCNSTDQLRAMDCDISVKDLHQMMQHGHKNITIDHHNKKPDGTRQSIRKGVSQHLFSMKKHRIRSKEKEQERAGRLESLEPATVADETVSYEVETIVEIFEETTADNDGDELEVHK